MDYSGVLPHIADRLGIPISLRVRFTNKISLEIDFSRGELDVKYRRLFRAPLHPFLHNISSMNVKNMMISIKPDGERSGIFIDADGVCYYISPQTWKLFRIGISKNLSYTNVLMDGELMRMNSFDKVIPPNIVLFDLLHWDRGDIPLDISDRSKICERILRTIVLDERSPISSLRMKKYYSARSMNKIWDIISSVSVRKDGLIFTPKMGEPGKNCVRWKPRPSITLGLEWLPEESDFALFFVERDRKRFKMRKRYYNVSRMSRVFSKDNASRIKDISTWNLLVRIQSMYVKAFKDGFINKYWDQMTEILIEISYWYDPFLDSSEIDIVKIRHDKVYPENIDIVPDLWKYMKSPLSLDDIFRKRVPSFYELWQPPTRKSYLWSQYVKKVKHAVYKRWVQSGDVLDMCSGRGGDLSMYYRLSISNRLRSVYLMEKDDTHIQIVKDSILFQHDNIANIDCKLKIIQADMNSKGLLSKLGRSYDTVVCANAIQFAMDPYEDQHGLNNIASLTKIGGTLIVMFMDGDSLEPSLVVNAKKKHLNCHHITTNNDLVEEPIRDPDLGVFYTLDNHIYWDRYESSGDYVCINDNNEGGVGLLYRYEPGETRVDNSYSKPSHIWVKLPCSLKAVREPIVRSSVLLQAMALRGFDIVSNNTLNEIVEERCMSNLSSIYRVAVFRKTKFDKRECSIIYMSDDSLHHTLLFLGVEDITSFACVHRHITNTCFEFLSRKKIGWSMLNKRKEVNECDYYISYS